MTEPNEINSSANEPVEINSSANEPGEIDSSANEPGEINSSANEPGEINSSANEPDLAFATPEKQKARAFLRERFLRVITGIIGKPTEFHLHENTHVSGEFRGSDVEFSKIFVRNLETPMGTVPEAILRSNDIICLDAEVDINIDQ